MFIDFGKGGRRTISSIRSIKSWNYWIWDQSLPEIMKWNFDKSLNLWSQETLKPRSQQSLKPRNFLTRKPRNQGTENQGTNKPKIQKPRNHMAIKHGSAEICRYLVDARADVHAADSKSCTAMHVASRFDRLEVAESLLDRRAIVNTKDVRASIFETQNGAYRKHIGTSCISGCAGPCSPTFQNTGNEKCMLRFTGGGGS